MAEKAPFQRIKIECKAAIKPYDPARILLQDPGNNDIINCYMKAAINVAESKNFDTRYKTRHKYTMIDGRYQSRQHATIYIRRNGITLAELERMVEFIHTHAEIIYSMTDPSNTWRILYDRTTPREHYP